MDYQIKTFSFQSKYDEVPIHGLCYVPEKPIGIFQMTHGMCEHKNRFVHFMAYMAEQGFITVMHDTRGHGESIKEEDDIGYCYESEAQGVVWDLYYITKRLRKEFPELPLVLYGHSMGSLAVRTYLKLYDDIVDAVVLAGTPAYQEAVAVARVALNILIAMKGARRRSPFFQGIVLSEFKKRFRKDKGEYAWLAAKESVGEKFLQDEKCTFTYTLNGFRTLLDLEYATYKGKGFQMKHTELPVLFISGMEDPCYLNEVKWQQSVERMRSLGYLNIREIRYENMRHEIHNEEDNRRVFQDVVDFCMEICKKTTN